MTGEQRPPDRPSSRWDWRGWGGGWGRRASLRSGLLLILIGAFFLLANLGLLEWLRWDLVWPALLILLGILLILRRR
jgi:hypothetical protein